VELTPLSTHWAPRKKIKKRVQSFSDTLYIAQRNGFHKKNYYSSTTLQSFQTKFIWKIKTHTLGSINVFPANRAVYEIVWKIMVTLDRLQMTV
jgi:hypothetical protein